MNILEYAKASINEVLENINKINSDKAEQLVDEIFAASKIFVAGKGRSGLMLQAFAMRLIHLGFQAFVVGEVVTPAASEEDLVIFGSGSGETESLIVLAQKAKKIGLKVALLTIFPKSSLGNYADLIIKIYGKSDKVESSCKSIQPAGGLFEQSMLIFLDSVIIRLAERGNIDISKFQRHANLE
jgi:6-phospho-3-hexuloisomerase